MGRPGVPAPRRAGRGRPASAASLAPWLVAGSGAALLVLGLVMTFSASFVASAVQTGDAYRIFVQQLRWAAVGLVPALVAASVDYRRWRPLAVPGLLLILLLCAAVLVPGLGVERGGARRWFDLGPAHLQPSELLKLAVPLAVAHLVARRWKAVRRGDLRALLLPSVPLLAIGGALVLAGPDLETAGLVLAIGGSVLWIAGLPWVLVGLAAAGGLGLAVVSVATSGFRRARVAVWLDPASDPARAGYQALQGLIALGSGGLLGVGLGRSRGKWLYVPAAHTDFIYAIIGEELGLVGALGVLLLFAGLAAGGTLAALHAPDPYGRLLAGSITVWLMLQAAMNIGSVVGLLPVTGVTLPLVSFGGSSLVVTMVGVGLLVSVARAGAAAGRGGGRRASPHAGARR